MELIQYNACVAIPRGIRDTSQDKFYEELGLESLQHCPWYKKLSYFCEFYKNEFSKYFFKLIAMRSSGYTARSA